MFDQKKHLYEPEDTKTKGLAEELLDRKVVEFKRNTNE
jgi:hypothetical protein